MAPAELRLLDRRPTISDSISAGPAPGQTVLNELVAQLADLVAAKVAARLAAPQPEAVDEWLDTRDAAAYLGIHRDSVRRLAAERAIPSEQAAGCKLFFRRSDLDAWRRRGSTSVVSIRSRRDG
jgi:excisionase family DNA binding protein